MANMGVVIDMLVYAFKLTISYTIT